MKKNLLILTGVFLSFIVRSQLSGVYNVPSDYSSIAAAVSDLNVQGVNGSVTITINAGHTETVPVGGLTLTATGTAVNSITFQKTGTGANPVLTAYAGGVATPASAVQDGIWSLAGSDYITIDGIDLVDPNISNTASMEYGYGLFKASATNGCNNVTIRNCTITLNRINNAAGAGPSTEGSRGINVVNALMTAQATSLAVSATAGSNSDNRFYGNVIQNCNTCISIVGFQDVAPFLFSDNNNVVGGVSAATSNTLLNYGGGGLNPAMAVRTSAQQNLSVSFNRINNNNGSGVHHTGVLKGICVEDAPSANVSVKSNSISLKFAGTSASVCVIENLSGTSGVSNTVEITSNTISACTNTATTSGIFYGIYNNGASCANLYIQGNTFTGNATNATGGSCYLIYNTGTVTSAMTVSSNTLGSFSYAGSFANTGQFYGVFSTASASTAVVNINGNIFSGLSYSQQGTGSVGFITNYGVNSSLSIANNGFNNLSVNNNGQHRLISNLGGSQQTFSISGNVIITGYSRTGSSGNTILISSGGTHGAACTGTVSNNYMVNVANSGTTTGSFNGFVLNDATNTPGVYARKSVFSNVLSTITYSTSAGITLYSFNGFGEGGTGIPSEVYNNLAYDVRTVGNIIGFSIQGTMGGTLPVAFTSNTISTLNTYTNNSSGNTAYIRGIYSSSSSGAGIILSSTKIFSLSAGGNQSLVYGIHLNESNSTTISNNMLGNLYAPRGYANSVIGVYLVCPTGTVNLFHNTVHLNGTSTTTGFGSSCVYSSGFEYLSMKNNILINNSVPVGFGRAIAFYRPSNIKSTYDVNSDRNIFYASGPGNAYLMSDATSNYANLPQLKTAYYPREANSFSENTPFANLSGSNPLFLHINLNAFSYASNNAVAIPGMSVDIDPDIRQGYPGYLGAGNAPDIGADEYEENTPNCSSANSIYIAPQTPTYCAGTNAIINSNITPSSGKILYQWKTSTVQAGPYTNVSSGGGINNISHITPTLSPGTYYYVLTNTCSVNGHTNTSNITTVTILAPPSASFSVVSPVCTGGTVSLSTASITGQTYYWNGPGFTSASASTTFPANDITRTGTYSLTVTAAGCSSTTSTYISIKRAPTALTASPASGSVCIGGSVNISTSGGLVNTAYSIGQGTSVNTYSQHLSPYSLYRSGEKMQMLVTVAELAAAGIQPNTPLTSIQFPVTSQGLYFSNGSMTNQSFSVKIGTTTATHFTLSGAFLGALTTVVTSGAFRSDVGYDNYHVFSTPFVWDGVNNLVVETSFSNNSYLTFPQQGAVYQEYTSMPDTMTIVYAADNQSAASIAGASSPSNYYKARPNFILNGLTQGTYSWGPATGLSATSGSMVTATPPATTQYTVSVSDGTCQATAKSSLSVMSPPTLTVSASVNSVCPNQPAVLSASGASAYLWSTGQNLQQITVTPAVGTTYSVTGTNAPCPSVTSTVAISVFTAPLVSMLVSPSSICNGGSATLSASGAVSYLWSNGATSPSVIVSPGSTTNYNVTGSNSQLCKSTANGQLIVNPLPVIQLSSSSRTICEGETVSLIASGSASSYTWSTSETSAVIVVSPPATTIYTVTASSLNGCINTSTIMQVVNLCAGIRQQNGSEGLFSVYPNPAAGDFTVEATEGASLVVLNNLGQVVLNEVLPGARTQVNITGLAQGVYQVRITYGSRQHTVKLVKQQ